MYRIEVHYEAETELKEASQYYEARVQGLGEKFLNEIDEAFAKINQIQYSL